MQSEHDTAPDNDNPDPSLYGDGSGNGFGGDPTAVSGEKCPGCGDNMIFDPKKGMLRCPSCGTTKEIVAGAGQEIAFAALRSATRSDWQNETHVYHCNNCNAEEVLAKREIAHVCPFCGSPSVVEREEMDTLRPNALLPFILDKTAAADAARKWAKGKLFAPRAFKTFFRPENINGTYLPAFTFDTQTFSTYDGRLGEYYYTTHRDSKGRTVRTQHTRYFPVAGNYSRFFDDIAVNATDAVPRKVMNTLMRYDYHNCVEYKEDFLYGFSALLYTRSGETCWEEAQENAKSVIRGDILAKYKHDTVAYLNVSTSFADITYKYLMLPMYTGNYRYKEKSYTFYINGRSGKAKGKSPVSPLRVSVAAVLGAAVVVGAAFLLHWLGVF